MAQLKSGQAGELILVEDGVRRMCPYDRTEWCGSGCAQFQIRPSYKAEHGTKMPATILLWCCDREMDIEDKPLSTTGEDK
jgi:hypothetical protein